MPDVSLPNTSEPVDAPRGAWTVALSDAPLPLADSDAASGPAEPDGASSGAASGADLGAVTLNVSVAGTLDPLAPGTMLGDYRILNVLGRGGFGVTYRARDGRSRREVAVKEFFPSGCVRRFEAGDHSAWSIEPTASLGAGAFEIARAQFVEGARILSRFRHPSLARVSAFFERCNTAYLVMELLEGRTLQQCVQEAGPLDEEGAIEIAHAVGEAVSTMHRLEVLHLDIKPENVMLCHAKPGDDEDSALAGSATSTCTHGWGDLKSARVVLFDFDLLQRIEPAGLGTRPLTSHCGTPGYAPLEQYAQHAALGRFSDVYALGATLFSLLCAQDPPAAADRALSESGFDPRAWRSDLSQEAASALAWAMEMSPSARPTSVEDWLPSLRQGRPQAPVPAPQVAQVADDANDSSFQIALAASGAGSSGSGALPGMLGSSISGVRVLPASLPQPTALPALPTVDNWFQLSSRDIQLDWPYSCACCGRRPDVSLQVKAGRARWGVPYCVRCARHVKAAHQASAGTAWGIVGGLVVAFIGWMMSDFWIGPIGVAIHFSALAYGALKIQAAEALMRPRCCDRKHAVGFGGERDTRAGKRYLVRFRSLKYAHEWKAKNASKL